MTNHGIPFNDTDRDVKNIERLLEPSPEQVKAAATLAFIEKRERTGNGAPTSRIAKQEERFSANWVRQYLPYGRFPWEPATPGHIHAEPVPESRWLRRQLNPPWWLRLLHRIGVLHEPTL